MKILKFLSLLTVLIFIFTSCEEEITPENKIITWSLEQFGGSPAEGETPENSSTGIIIKFSDDVFYLDYNEITISGSAILNDSIGPGWNGYNCIIPIIAIESGIATVTIKKNGVESGSKNVFVYKDLSFVVIFNKNNQDPDGTEAIPRAVTASLSTSKINNLPVQPTWPGHGFIEWRDINGYIFTTDTVLTENITVYAQWSVNWDEFFIEVIDKLPITNPIFGRLLAHNANQPPFTIVPVTGSIINHFFNELDIDTSKMLPITRFNRPGTPLTEIKYILYHDTANTGVSPALGTAAAHADFLHTTTSSVSWHYTVDSTNIYQHIPDNEVAWHGGNSYANTRSIGIETCVNYGTIKGDMYQTWQRTAKLIAILLDKYDLPVERVITHKEISILGQGSYVKCCPITLRHSGLWPLTVDMIRSELNILQKLTKAGYSIEIIIDPASQEFINSRGRIIKLGTDPVTVSYTIRVTTSSNVSHEKKYSVVLPAQSVDYITRCDIGNCGINNITSIPD